MTKHVLLIDDDRDDAEIFQEALSDADGTAVFNYIDDGRDALRQLSEQTALSPHIIFLDVNMPAISGWECLKQIKNNEKLRHIPVVMYSTSSHQREAAIAADLGAATFITKPHNYNELKRKITDLLAEYIAS